MDTNTAITKSNGTRSTAQIAVLNQYDRTKYNVLAPLSIHALSPFHTVGVEIVELSADPSKGDCFKTGSSKTAQGWQDVLALSKVGLLKLGDAAGIVWDVNECKRLDNFQNPLYVAYQAQGRIRRPDGTWIKVRSTKELDLDVIREEIRDRVEGDKNSAELTSEQKDAKVFKEWIQRRKHKVALCETGAMNRVLRQLLKIKSGYTPEELRKPFVIARVDLDLSANPALREAFRIKVMQDVDDLFGGGGPEPAKLAEAEKLLALVEPSVETDGETIDEETGEIIEGAAIDDTPDFPADLTATAIPEPQDEAAAKADQREKIAAIVATRKLTDDQLEKWCQKHYRCGYAALSLDGLVDLAEALQAPAKAG